MNIWIAGARPKTLPAAIAPVLVGSALAHESFNFLTALLALSVSLSLQIGVNYANDYSDGVRGTDEVRVGPIRITASGLASPASVKRAAYIAFFIGALAGFFLSALTTWWLIAIGATAIIAAWKYTGGRNPYGYNGLGELFVFIYFGIVATVGTYYVQAKDLTITAFLVAIPVGLLACLILAVNNIRDRVHDQAVGKRTSAVRLGDKKARLIAIAILVFAHLIPITFSLHAFVTTILLAPISFSIGRGLLAGTSGSELIPYIARTGKLHLAFSIALSLGLLF